MSPGSNPASFRDHRHNLPQSQHTTYDNAAEESGAVQLRTLRERLRLPIRLNIPFQFSDPLCSIAAFEELADSLIERIPSESQLKPFLNQSVGQTGFFTESQKSELKQIEGSIRKALSEAIKPLTQYADMLFAFSESNAALASLEASPDFDPDIYQYELEDQQKDRKLSSVDAHLLLWIIHLITTGSRAKSRSAKPLPPYTHVAIDEAQYYSPVLLRLFRELIRHEDREGVMTIVGDLEQRISSKGAGMSWEEFGLELDQSRIKRLGTNYRWTTEVFKFLRLIHGAIGVTESLKEPHKWRVDGWRQPEIAFIADANSEVELLCDRINEIRSDPNAQNWTVAVIVAHDVPDAVQRRIVGGLKDCGIAAKWATGDDDRETVDKVIITDCDCIVGLEVDCVCLLGAHILFAGFHETVEIGHQEMICQAWVALTRAKRFIFITTIEDDPVLSRVEFDPYKN